MSRDPTPRTLLVSPGAFQTAVAEPVAEGFVSSAVGAREAEASRPPTEAFSAILVGFDVEGFSRVVERATLVHGRGAGELAAQQILAGERIANDLAREAGLTFADALGDGAVYLRRQQRVTAQDHRAIQRFEEELKYAHLKATGMAVRTAWSHGQVRLCRPGVRILEHDALLWGPAVADLHGTLSTRPRRRWPAPPPADRAPNLAHRAGEIIDMTFVFLRLHAAGAWEKLDEASLANALGLIDRWAARLGGGLERVTQDEKGVHARVGLPGADAGVRDWREALGEPQDSLRRLGFDGAMAAAAGAVYRGPSQNGSTIVHGGAVNRAAKLCAAQPPGGLALDASLVGRTVRDLPTAGEAVGRRVEFAKARAWLAGGGARLTVLSGEAGIGKSHLMADIVARGAGRSSAFVAGAPARMLDPMSAWFELLRRALVGRAPEGDDLAWAVAALAAAGLEPWTAALCARALRGVAVAGAEAPALTGGERARHTRRAMLALIAALARDGPFMVAIDDLHEVDQASLDLTLAILDEELPLRVIATRRPTPDDERLAGLLGHLSALDIPLAPLAAPDIAELVGGLGADGVDVAGVTTLSGGNPFRAVQAALAMADRDDLAGDGALNAIIDHRLNRLDDEERAILRAMAITDQSFTEADIRALAAPGDGAAGTSLALRRLKDARLIAVSTADGGGFQVSHRLLAEHVRRRMPAGVTRVLARAAARRLTRGGAAPKVEVARLWAQAGVLARAAILYEQAAREAAMLGADAVCVKLLGLALELFADTPRRASPRRSIRWLAEMGRAQWSLGQVDVANRSARLAAARARLGRLPPRLRQSALAAAALRLETGQFLGDLGEIILGGLGAGRSGAQGRELSAVGYLFGLARLGAAADAVLDRGERLADADEPRPAAFALTARAVLRFMFSRWAEGEAALEKAREICLAHPQHHLMEVIETILGLGAHLQGDGARALDCFETLGRRASRRGASLNIAWADYATAQTLMALDRPHEAWARLRAAEERLKGLSDRQSVNICLGLRARLAWRLGEVDEALSAALLCGGMSRTMSPTNFSSIEAFAAPAMVGALAMTRTLSPRQGLVAEALVREHLGDLRRYALIFPIARPRLRLVEGVVAAGRRRRGAVSDFEAAAARAEHMGLGFELRLARRIAADLSLAR